MTIGNETNETATALGLMRGVRLWLRNAPEALRNAIDPEAIGAELLASPSTGMEVAVIVIDDEARLDRDLQALSGLMQPSGHVWLLWEGDALSADMLADRVQSDGFIPGDVHRIAERWNGLKLDAAPAQ
ncbi:hypothetical protein [Sphingomonas sp. AX6]|uniref:hypothetical protein n=1 Tax=Sphingomonas sp. AX6 TaxID=2653171 RepID=UPI00135C6409|nr:hypothetical protein [Sphingomonas sp. AX6]